MSADTLVIVFLIVLIVVVYVYGLVSKKRPTHFSNAKYDTKQEGYEKRPDDQIIISLLVNDKANTGCSPPTDLGEIRECQTCNQNKQRAGKVEIKIRLDCHG